MTMQAKAWEGRRMWRRSGGVAAWQAWRGGGVVTGLVFTWPHIRREETPLPLPADFYLPM